ncbi:MAG: hypothetical protein ABIK18_00015 [candidate division WOR-3 bacterium]
MFRRIIPIAILAVLLLSGVASAQQIQVPEGLFLWTYHRNGSAADYCYVVASYYRSGWSQSRYYTTGFTGPGGRSDYPPDYNICRFAREEVTPPGYIIPYDTVYRWRFYAYKWMGGEKYYSEWSKVMQYGPGHWFDQDALYLTRTTPPLPDPPWVAEE